MEVALLILAVTNAFLVYVISKLSKEIDRKERYIKWLRKEK